MSRSLVLVAVAALVGCGDAAKSQGPYAREVAEATPKIEQATGLTFKTPPKVELRTPDEVRQFLTRKFDESSPALELAGQQAAYRLLGLLPESLDLRAFLLDLLSEQVIGYYDPATRVLYVVSDTSQGRAALVGVTVTHELVHALQDQYLPLDSLEKLRGDNDRLLAMQALLEGQATLEQTAIMIGGGSVFRLPGGWDRVREMIRENQTAMPKFAAAPMLLQEELLFPYLSGAEFVRRAKEARGGAAPFAPIPASTEQILHVEKYLSGEPPIGLVLPAVNGTLVYENGFGEFETRLALFQQIKAVDRVARAAAGWGGDRYAVVNGPRGAALGWVSVWDSAVDAAEFRAELEAATAKRLGATLSGASERRQLVGKGRAVEIRSLTIGGHPAVWYADVPQGAPAPFDVGKVTVRP